MILRHHLSRASRDTGRTTPQTASLRNLCVLRVSALDSSSLGLILSPSSTHLCALCVLCGENSLSFRSSLIPRRSPLTSKSFTIRTSKTPLPQLLYNPHLQAPLGSAGNKGLITPLESALTKRWGVGVRGIPVRILGSGEVSWTSATGDAATGRSSPISFPCHTSEKVLQVRILKGL